jgi:signal transduction histidine kinase
MLCPNKVASFASTVHTVKHWRRIPLWLIQTLALLLIFFSGEKAFAQSTGTADYIIRRYTTENGLPQNSIKGLAFDHLGYCWIGTENGLIKYDGVNFRLYEDFKTPPASARVAFIKQDEKQQILIAFEGGQLYKIKEVDYFGTVPAADSGTYIWGNGQSFVEVKSGVGQFFNKLINTYVRRASDDYFLIDERVLYIKTVDSLVIAGADKRVKTISGELAALSANTVISGLFTLFTGKNTAVTVNHKGEVSQPITLKGDFFNDMDLTAVNYSLMRSRKVTYGFCKGNLYRLEFGDRFIQSVPVIRGLDDMTISEVYYDEASETYYLQSRIDGLAVARKSRFENVVVPNADWRTNSFYGQSLYKQDQIIANGHLFSFEKNKKQPSVKRLLTTGNLLSTYIQGDNYYYESDFKLHKYNIKSSKDSVIAALGDLAHCFQRSPVDQTLYFSTTDKLFALKNDKPQFLLALPQAKNWYIYSFVFVARDSVLIATNRGLWAGSLRTGLSREVIKDVNVRNVYLGRDGYIWLGTYNQGCYLFKNGRFVQLPLDHNRRMTVVNSIVEDNRGRIWFSTNNGLLRIRRKALTDYFHRTETNIIYHVYDKNDGLITNEFNGSGTPDKVFLSDGRVSLPSLKSLVLFNPDNFPVDSVGKKVFIDRATLDDVPLDRLSDLVLPAGFGALVLSVSSPLVNNAEILHFERKVNGVDKGWISFRSTDDIDIRGYLHGDYRMNIRIKGSPGSQIQLRFRVAPRFYETIWFKFAVGLATFIIIVLFFRSSIRYYKNENLILDKRIRERTGELNESLENLNVTVNQLQQTETRLQTSVLQKEQIINLLLHDMKSPLFALKKGIEELDYKLGVQPGLPTEIVGKSKLLREGISDVYSFSVNFFEWVKYQKEGITANNQLTSLGRVFDTIQELYGGIAERKGILLEVESVDIQFYTDENILVTVLRNLVDNAIKNTEVGKVRLSAHAEPGKYIVITVEDSGQGMQEDVMKTLSEAFYDETVLDGLVGYGYKLVVHLTGLIHGDIELENNSGLQVRLYLNYVTGPAQAAKL